jgi:hypothetical protein
VNRHTIGRKKISPGSVNSRAAARAADGADRRVPPVIPLTSHAIVVPLGRQKEAVKVCVSPNPMLAAEGETEPDAEHVIVILALPDFELSAMLVAATLTVAGDGGTVGAV